ncbi:MAG: hypothetical protein LC115_08600 [Bacteroidia bacterium]|nr:hypothetical protein [Bacteroidia bacterium]
MKLRILFISLFFIVYYHSFGQFTLKLGGYLEGYSGVTYGFFGNLKKDLTTPSFLTDSVTKLPAVGSYYGGGFKFLVAKKIILGLYGVGSAHTPAEGKRGQAKMYTTLWGGQVGFAVKNTNRWLWYPYAGFSVGKSTLKLSNYDNQSVVFGENQTIERAKTIECTTTSSVVDLGFSFRHLSRNSGGLILGVDGGFYLSPAKGTWSGPVGAVSGVKGSSLNGIYLRVTIGAGLFSIESSSKPPTEDEKPAQENPANEEPKQ